MPTSLAERIDARTPHERNRYADLLRLGSILMVVIGHWMVAVVLIRDGELVTGQLLAFVPETQWLTYLWQVMPLFFVVGGFVNAGSWHRALEAGEGWAAWVRRRARRLLGPLLPLLCLWIPVALVLGATDIPEDVVALAARTAFIPVWFLVVYLGVIALVPLTWRLHRRFGLPVLMVAAGLVGLIDLLHRAEVPVVGFANYLLVWGAAHQVGYLWFDDRLPDRSGPALGLAGAAAAVLAGLVAFGGYPLSMVAVEGAARSNTDPPSLALYALMVIQVGLVIALRGPFERWLRRPRVWAPVVVAGGVTMTMFLWHMTAMVLVVALTHPTGLWPETERIDGTWWALRPLWLGLCGLVLAGLGVVFRRFEEVRDPIPRSGRLRTLVGLVATIAGLGMILTGGVYQPDRTAGVPVGALGLLLVGLGGLGVLRPGSDDEDEGDGADHERAATRHAGGRRRADGR